MKLFYDFAKSNKSEFITFTFNEGELKCGSSIYSLGSIKLEKVDWNDDLDLQINYDEYSLIYEFLNNGIGFIEKHQLEQKLEKANSNLNSSINKAFELLRTNYAVKDPQDLLAMSALQLLSKNQSSAKTETVTLPADYTSIENALAQLANDLEELN